MVARRLRLFRIVLASPADVERDWRVAQDVVEELNRSVARQLNLQLDLSTWKTDVYPAFHPQGPQSHIDERLKLEDCDVLLAIFWTRFGTPVANAQSGTEHEILRAIELWRSSGRPQVMVYFKRKPYEPRSSEDHVQWLKVREFRDNFPPQGLWRDYRTGPEFGKRLRLDLTAIIQKTTEKPAKPPRKRPRTKMGRAYAASPSRPRILLEYSQSFRDTSEIEQITVHNVGGEPAVNATIRPVIHSSERLVFPELPQVHRDKPRQIKPELRNKKKAISVLFRHHVADFLDSIWLERKWQSSLKTGTSKAMISRIVGSPLVLPVTVRYYDVAGKRYESEHELVFNYFSREAHVRLKRRAAA